MEYCSHVCTVLIVSKILAELPLSTLLPIPLPTPPPTHTHTHTQVFFDPLVESEVLSEEELSKVRVNWEELLQSNSELLK